MLIDKSSQPWAFLGSSDHIIDKIFPPVISTSDSEEFHLKTKLGKVLSLFIREHCLTKWSLKIFAFI